jgi:cytochrome c oxidase subunit II
MALKLLAVALAFGGLGFIGAGWAQRDAGSNRIDLTATKYAFSHSEVRLRKGRPMTFVLNSADFPHGFSVPDLNLRADLIPGKPIVVRITAQRAGKFVFLCDNFCGEGHDRMSGFLIVDE